MSQEAEQLAASLHDLISGDGNWGKAAAAPFIAEASGAFLTALHPSLGLLAVIGRQKAVILDVSAGATLPAFPSFTPALCVSPEAVTAATWVVFAGGGGDGCLVVGTSAGRLQVHSLQGTLLHGQRLHTLPVVALRVRAGEQGTDSQGGESDVTATFPDGAARLSGWELRSLLRLQRQGWTEPDCLQPLGYSRWDLHRNAGARADSICVGMRPPSLQTLMRGGAGGDAKVALVSVGTKPVVAAFEVEERAARGAIAMVADLASSLKGWLPSPLRRAGRVPEAALPPPDDWRPAEVVADDGTRCATSLLLAPRGVLAAATDTLGRVLLVDVAAVAVVRLFKGCRDAQCGWLLLPPPPPLDGDTARDGAASSGSHPPPDRPPSANSDGHHRKRSRSGASAVPDVPAPRGSLPAAAAPPPAGPAGGAASGTAAASSRPSAAGWAASAPAPAEGSRAGGDSGGGTAGGGGGGASSSSGAGPAGGLVDTEVHLLIYAPRRGVVDVYRARHGPPRCSIPCSGNCRLLMPPEVMGGGGGGGGGDCLLLDFDTGQLVSMRLRILEAS